MSNQPSIAIVIPLYNKRPYILRAIQSVQAQSIQDFEVIVVDDGSKDGGADLVEQMDDARVRLIRQKNAGQSAARNTGIENSTAPLLCFLDADDVWKPEFLEAVLSLSKTYPEAGLYATGYKALHPGGLAREVTLDLPAGSGTQYLIRDYFRKAREASFVWVTAVAVPRRIFEELGVFQVGEHRGGDRDMWGRIALFHPVAYDSRLLAVYRADATGRENPRGDRKLQRPPFIRYVRELDQIDKLAPAARDELNEYLNHMWLGYAGSCILAGDRSELRHVLEKEIRETRVYRKLVFRMRIAARILPMKILRLLKQFSTSRWSRKFIPIQRGAMVRVNLRPVSADEIKVDE